MAAGNLKSETGAELEILDPLTGSENDQLTNDGHGTGTAGS